MRVLGAPSEALHARPIGQREDSRRRRQDIGGRSMWAGRAVRHPPIRLKSRFTHPWPSWRYMTLVVKK